MLLPDFFQSCAPYNPEKPTARFVVCNADNIGEYFELYSELPQTDLSTIGGYAFAFSIITNQISSDYEANASYFEQHPNNRDLYDNGMNEAQKAQDYLDNPAAPPAICAMM